VTVVITVAVFAVLLLVAVVTKVATGDASTSSAQPSSTAAGKSPNWNAEQQRTYLDTLSALDPGLVANEDRAIRRAERICDRILNPPGGTMSLERYVVEELSGGNATIDEETAKTVIAAVKVWCR